MINSKNTILILTSIEIIIVRVVATVAIQLQWCINTKLQIANILPREIPQGRDFLFHGANKFQISNMSPI